MTDQTLLDRMGMFLFPWGKKPPSGRQLIDAAKETELLGLDSVHIPYFYGLDTDLWPWGNESVVDALSVLPYVLTETDRIRIGLTHWNFSMFHPFVWAQYLSTLQLAGKGRIMTTVAQGRRWQDFQVGMSPRDDAERRLTAGAEVLSLLFSGADIPDSPDSIWDVTGLQLDPGPQHEIEVWVNGSSDIDIEVAARWARCLKPSGKGPLEVRNTLRPALDTAASRYGRDVSLAMSTLVFVADPEDDPGWLTSHIEPLLEHERPGGAHGVTHIYGSPDTCAEQLSALLEAGVDYLALDLHFHGWETLDLGMEQLHRLVERVVPLMDPGILRPAKVLT